MSGAIKIRHHLQLAGAERNDQVGRVRTFRLFFLSPSVFIRSIVVQQCNDRHTIHTHQTTRSNRDLSFFHQRFPFFFRKSFSLPVDLFWIDSAHLVRLLRAQTVARHLRDVSSNNAVKVGGSLHSRFAAALSKGVQRAVADRSDGDDLWRYCW